MARQAFSGRLLLGGCDDEVYVLDGAVSGPVLYDAQTGKVSVGEDSGVALLKDNFSYSNTCGPTIFGFPVYGLQPPCHQPGENPDREVAIIRPPNSPYGTIYAHQTVCVSTVGLRPEITPVQLVPDPFPSIAPTGLHSVAWIDIPPGEDCSGPKRYYLKTPGEHISSVDGPNIRNWDWPDEPINEVHTPEYGMAAWLYNATSTKWELQKVSNASLEALIKRIVPPNEGIIHQTPWYSIGLVGFDLSPSQLLMTFDPSTLPGYLPKYKTMWLQTRLIASAHGEDYRIQINVGAQPVHNGIVREEAASNAGLTVDFINPTYVFPVPITAGNLQVMKYVTILGGHEAVSPYELEYELKLVGWQQ
jgi:hypothetical protein